MPSYSWWARYSKPNIDTIPMLVNLNRYDTDTSIGTGNIEYRDTVSVSCPPSQRDTTTPTANKPPWPAASVPIWPYTVRKLCFCFHRCTFYDLNFFITSCIQSKYAIITSCLKNHKSRTTLCHNWITFILTLTYNNWCECQNNVTRVDFFLEINIKYTKSS